MHAYVYWYAFGYVYLLLCYYQDGRILFMDPSERGKRHMEFRVNKDPVVWLHHDSQHGSLVTRCDGTNAALFQVWSLPQLHLLYEVYTRLNVTSCARLVGILHEHRAVVCVTSKNTWYTAKWWSFGWYTQLGEVLEW